MKEQYFKNLEDYLIDKEIEKEDIEEILTDYIEFYDEYINKGLTNEEIIIKLGTPSDVYRNIKGTINKTRKHKFHDKLLSLSPFVATALFVLIGFFSGIWHPTWLVFLITPILGTIGSRKTFIANLGNVLVFVGLAVAILLPEFNILPWKYSWLFMLVFIFFSAVSENEKLDYKIIVLEVSIFLAIVSYILLAVNGIKVPIALLSFLLPFIVSVWTKHIEVNVNFGEGKKRVIIVISLIVALVLFFVLGFMYSNWAYIWQVLFLPVIVSTLILPENNKYKLTSIMPFIATILFFSIGYFYSAWAVSWLAFLLIPAIAIIEDR